MKLITLLSILLYMCNHIQCLLPPKFQWKIIDFAWEGNRRREDALASGDYIPENNMPAGIARWKNKLFITIPRWKNGVPSSLNYIYVNGSQSQPLHPFPSWKVGFVSDKSNNITMDGTVVSTFRVHVDKCDRLWVVDNGVADMSRELRQVTQPAIVVYDLNDDSLIHRYVINDEVLRDSTVLTSIVVDIVGKGCGDAYAFIPDMGSNALLVYSTRKEDIWRVENHFFHFDPKAGVYKILGDRGEKSQATASAFDLNNNVLFYTQLSKNGVSCWNTDKPLTPENVPLIISDCIVLEFPNDIKVDKEGNLWILSNRQSRFLYESMDFNQVNFRVLTAPVSMVVRDTPCEKLSTIGRALSFIKKNKTKKT